MKNPPLVTVVVSCYNHEAYITACIDSILEQTYPNIELLVFDDGSSDRSADLIEELADRHGFYFHRGQNRGLSATLNMALEKASGKYFCVVGSDDILLHDKTAKQVRMMESNEEIAACGGNIVVIDECGRVSSQKQRLSAERWLDFDDIFQRKKPVILTPTAMFRTAVLKAVGGYREDLMLEDFALWLKLSSQGHKILVLDDILVYYRKHDGNNYKNYRMMFDAIMTSLEEYKTEKTYEDVVAGYIISYVLKAASAGDKPLLRYLLGRLPWRYFNLKVLRALPALLR